MGGDFKGGIFWALGGVKKIWFLKNYCCFRFFGNKKKGKLRENWLGAKGPWWCRLRGFQKKGIEESESGGIYRAKRWKKSQLPAVNFFLFSSWRFFHFWWNWNPFLMVFSNLQNQAVGDFHSVLN